MRHYFFVILLILFLFSFSSVNALEEDSIINENDSNIEDTTSLNESDETNNIEEENTDDNIGLNDTEYNKDFDNSDNNSDIDNSDINIEDTTIDDKDYIEVSDAEDDEDNSEQLETDGILLSMGFFNEPSNINQDYEIENPETSDDIYLYLVLFILSPIFIIYFIRRLILS